MAQPYVRYALADGVATLTLDSPHNRNALSSRLLAELREGLARAGADTAVRAVVLTHTGRTFCAGADLTEADPGESAARVTAGHRLTPDDAAAAALARTRTMVDLLRAILELPKPVVGRIDGHVRAGGMGLVGACDLVVAGPACTFALTEVRLGLAASVISPVVLPRLTDRAASRYFLTGETFGPAEAAALGFVTVAPERVDEALDGLLAALRLGSPQGLAETKKLTTASVLAEFDRSAERLTEQSTRLFGSPESREGMLAFLQKRPPSWAPAAPGRA